MDSKRLVRVGALLFAMFSVGLGLSIAHAIVEMHGGERGRDLAARVGTTFRVQLSAGS